MRLIFFCSFEFVSAINAKRNDDKSPILYGIEMSSRYVVHDFVVSHKTLLRYIAEDRRRCQFLIIL